MTSQINRLAAMFVAAFALVIGATGYWAFLRAEDLTARGDNPRRILLERRVPRGPILDRHGEVLAATVGPPGELTRHYHYPLLSPLLGYVSPLYGRTGLEAAFDLVLHGDEGYDPVELWRMETVLGSPPPGRGVRLTLDLAVQQAADAALGDRAGAVVVLNSETGEILALASHPTYDANTLEDTWDDLIADPASPLLHRAVLGLYQPGGALAPAVLARALATGNVTLAAPASTDPFDLGGQTLTCLAIPADASLAAAFLGGCPTPLADLGEALGPQALQDLFQSLRLYEPPAIGLPAGAAPDTAVTDPALAALGQDTLVISPLQLALITAALAEDGTLAAPRLVLETQARDGAWRPVPAASPAANALPAGSAADVAALLAPEGFAATAFSGDASTRLAWYAAFGPQEDAEYVVVVLLENGEPAVAQAIGQQVLEAALP